MKTRMVVGPPPLKYLKKYGKGGTLSPFEKAFAQARKEKGANATFTYNGKLYTTQYKEEVGASKPTATSTSKAPVITGSSFNEAFAKARQSLGAGKTFEYNGKLYGTNYATEVQKPAAPKTETVKKELPNGALVNQRLTAQNTKPGYGITSQAKEGGFKPTVKPDIKKPGIPLSEILSTAVMPKKPMVLLDKPITSQKSTPVSTTTSKPVTKPKQDTTFTAKGSPVTVTASRIAKEKPKSDTTFTASIKPVDVTAKKINKSGVTKMSMLPDFTKTQQSEKETIAKSKPILDKEIYEIYSKSKKQYQPGDKVRIRNTNSEKGYDEVTIPNYESFAEYFAKIPKKELGKSVTETTLNDTWRRNMPELYRRFVWVPSVNSAFKESKKLFLETGFDTFGKKEEDVGKFQKFIGLPLTETQKRKQEILRKKRKLGIDYQNGGQLSNLANTISAVGGIASAIPGVGAIPGAIASVAAPILQAVSAQQAARSSFNKMYSSTPMMAKGGLIKRKDGSYSQRGLWDNIRANKGSGKKPTKQMLEQERKIKAKMEFGGTLQGADDLTFYKGRKHSTGGIMVSAKGTPAKKAVAEVEGGETRYLRKGGTYIFSDKLLV